jgi:hypothetical protein
LGHYADLVVPVQLHREHGGDGAICNPGMVARTFRHSRIASGTGPPGARTGSVDMGEQETFGLRATSSVRDRGVQDAVALVVVLYQATGLTSPRL